MHVTKQFFSHPARLLLKVLTIYGKYLTGGNTSRTKIAQEKLDIQSFANAYILSWGNTPKSRAQKGALSWKKNLGAGYSLDILGSICLTVLLGPVILILILDATWELDISLYITV